MAKSRPKRWAEAATKARAAMDDLKAALEDLRGLKDEYENWQANLPENLQSSTLNDKLQEVADLELEDPDDLDSAIDTAENIDLPRGFGRD